tara:strand:- start:17144 stop:18460 length:1317 start_codon:yes stop_codon:yes gene_type:complete
MFSKLFEEKDFDLIGNSMIDFAKELFPLNRSLAGPDIKYSLKKFIDKNKDFKALNFATGEKVFDWEIPEEWIIRDAYLEHESGQRFAEFKKNNLHIMGYSIPVNEIISKNELLNKIHTLSKHSDAIPYVTSYYKKDWAFCLSHQELKALPEGKYKVFIDSEHIKGELRLIEAIIPGKSKKEIFFSSYLCHPSMANNELSGPILLNEILNLVKNIKERHYTYRFVILPETIGSIAYLSRRLNILKEQMICGFNLSCVGDERSYSHVKSRLGNNLADQAIKSALIGFENVFEYSFLERGSDERQYCAPGIDLPLCTFCRTKFARYPEYHTSKDNFSVVTSNGLRDSFKVMKNIIEAFEIGLFPNIEVLGEPQLGKRNLYPNTSKRYQRPDDVKRRMDTLAYCDSNHSLFDISKIINCNLAEVLKEIYVLKENKIIKTYHV